MEKVKRIGQYQFWAQFYGLLYIVGGAILCVTIIGIIVGVPIIMAGNNLRKSGLEMKTAVLSEGAIPIVGEDQYQKFFRKLAFYFKIGTIYFIISYVYVIVISVVNVFFIYRQYAY